MLHKRIEKTVYKTIYICEKCSKEFEKESVCEAHNFFEHIENKIEVKNDLIRFATNEEKDLYFKYRGKFPITFSTFNLGIKREYDDCDEYNNEVYRQFSIDRIPLNSWVYIRPIYHNCENEIKIYSRYDYCKYIEWENNRLRETIRDNEEKMKIINEMEEK